MRKGTEHFRNTIQAKLEEMASNDPLFAKSLAKENKSLDGCINYIFNQVQQIGAHGYTDGEIYGMATHYYDEDDLEECDPIQCGVVVNHRPELTKEEKQELKEQVRREELEKERRRLHSRKRKSNSTRSNKNKKENQQSSLF